METKKKAAKKRKLTPFTKFICVAMILASGFMLFAVVQEGMTTLQLQQQLSEVQSKLQEVQDENRYLTNEKEKLQDPDYVETYARGKYQLSKDGEQIFYLPENTEK
ncbi:MAG: septum formation initiator family protein [Bulleidia sp.]|nr:septum formation initiator family protein [Erysipelotrichaceae bacterium]MDD6663516.1 septum formation initiator family protein [Bulleidia sp.]MDY4810361.1 septum formation initiator family protein [Bulleidia sp.]